MIEQTYFCSLKDGRSARQRYLAWRGTEGTTARQRKKYMIKYRKSERTVTIVAACTILHEVQRGVISQYRECAKQAPLTS